LAEIGWATWDFVPHFVPHGHETIAEGVKDAETLTLLGDYGVDLAQGFHSDGAAWSPTPTSATEHPFSSVRDQRKRTASGTRPRCGLGQ
jgi:EAL domain-containing protein (putative c-di-GMP-specific phosphodiesterase class I)